MNHKRTEYKVSDFLEWQRGDQLELSPDFQRRSVWKPGAKSFLIDTVLRGYPTPPIFLRDLPTNLSTLKSQREVVDGQQRLRTLISYIDSNLIKDDSNSEFVIMKAHNPDLAGKKFNELSEKQRQTILDYQFSVTVFPADTGDSQILNVFARMNATGVSLNPQELRNANYYGEFKSCAYELASEFLDFWTNYSILNRSQIARMKEVELTSDLIALITKGIMPKSKKALDDIYKEYDDAFPGQNEIEKRFRSVINEIQSADCNFIVQLFSKQTMFYALFASVYQILWGLQSPLTRTSKNPITKSDWNTLYARGIKIANATAPQAVLTAATTRTTHASSRRAIIKYLTK